MVVAEAWHCTHSSTTATTNATALTGAGAGTAIAEVR
jgi:hypothetical protein